MNVFSRFKKMIAGAKSAPSDPLFQYYYGSVLSDHRDSGISAGEARRDFEQIRQTVSRVNTYSPVRQVKVGTGRFPEEE